MGARVIRRRVASEYRRKQELRTLVLITGATALPLFLALLLVAADMRSDLSDLKPIQSSADQAIALIGWGDLEASDDPSASTESARSQDPRRVRMLGYMMEGYPPSGDGRLVKGFVLMPEAGHILHPAHHIPDQMVEIRLKDAAPFNFRTLVWASGTLARIAGRPKSGEAMYAMTDATVEPAAQSDITRWFTP